MTRALSFHSSYRCRDSGHCCSAGWPIPVEPDRAGALARLGGRRSMRLLPVVGGRCLFHDDARRRCQAQETLGHAALPLACRQFPRVSVIDPRGVSVTLSHFCPTARALLDDGGASEIVVNAPAFPPEGEYEGLDVRATLPPLLRPDMLMDWESWWLWEAESVALIAARAASPGTALAALAVAVDDLRGWSPDRGPLDQAVRSAFVRGRESRALPRVDSRVRQAWVDDVVASIPPSHRPRVLERTTSAPAPGVLARFLAAHAFASWSAHLGTGLHAWLRSLDVACALAEDVGVRQADLLLRHLADPDVLATVWSGRSSDRPSRSAGLKTGRSIPTRSA